MCTYSPWGRKESDMTERLSLSISFIELLDEWIRGYYCCSVFDFLQVFWLKFMCSICEQNEKCELEGNTGE